MEIIILSAVTIGLCIGINAIQIYFNKPLKIQDEPSIVLKNIQKKSHPIAIKPKRVTFAI